MAEDRRVQGYCFYDWGKSAFETSVTTAILPGWFTFLFLRANGLTTKILGTEWTADAIFSISVSVAAFIVAVMSPSFGVIADRRMIKMWWLRVLTYLGAGSTILLAAVAFLNIHLTQQAKAGSPPNLRVMKVIPLVTRTSLVLVLIGIATMTTSF